MRQLPVLFLLAASGSAAAADTSLAEHSVRTLVDDDEPTEGGEVASARKRKKADGGTPPHFEVGMRARRMTLPKGVMNLWYHDANSPAWPLDDEERPGVSGWSYGLEFTIQNQASNYVFWFDYLDSEMPEGYWDDVEDPPDPFDGDWIRPSNNVGMSMFGFDYTQDVALVKPKNTKGAFGMSLIVGGGVGLGIITGEFDRWIQDDNVPSYELVSQGVPPNAPDKVTRVFPILDLNLGVKFLFAERGFIRFEGGIHTLLFYGMSAGYRF